MGLCEWSLTLEPLEHSRFFVLKSVSRGRSIRGQDLFVRINATDPEIFPENLAWKLKAFERKKWIEVEHAEAGKPGSLLLDNKYRRTNEGEQVLQVSIRYYQMLGKPGAEFDPKAQPVSLENFPTFRQAVVMSAIQNIRGMTMDYLLQSINNHFPQVQRDSIRKILTTISRKGWLIRIVSEEKDTFYLTPYGEKCLNSMLAFYDGYAKK